MHGVEPRPFRLVERAEHRVRGERPVMRLEAVEGVAQSLGFLLDLAVVGRN